MFSGSPRCTPKLFPGEKEINTTQLETAHAAPASSMRMSLSALEVDGLGKGKMQAALPPLGSAPAVVSLGFILGIGDLGFRIQARCRPPSRPPTPPLLWSDFCSFSVIHHNLPYFHYLKSLFFV